MIKPISDRDTFRRLGRAPRRRRGPLGVAYGQFTGGGGAVEGGALVDPRVAFAIGRGVGGAVVRNRLRRQLRECTRHCQCEFRQGGAYLFSARPEATKLSYPQLAELVELLVRDAHRSVQVASPDG